MTACPGTSLSRRVPWRRAEGRTKEKEQKREKKWIGNEVPGMTECEDLLFLLDGRGDKDSDIKEREFSVCSKNIITI